MKIYGLHPKVDQSGILGVQHLSQLILKLTKVVKVIPKLPVDRLQHLPLLLLRVEAGVQLGLHLVQGQLQALVLQLDGLHLLAAAAALGLQLPDLVVLLSKLLLPLVDAPSHLPQLTNLQQPIGDGFHKAKWKFSILKKVLQKCQPGWESHRVPYFRFKGVVR